MAYFHFDDWQSSTLGPQRKLAVSSTTATKRDQKMLVILLMSLFSLHAFSMVCVFHSGKVSVSRAEASIEANSLSSLFSCQYQFGHKWAAIMHTKWEQTNAVFLLFSVHSTFRRVFCFWIFCEHQKGYTHRLFGWVYFFNDFFLELKL